MFDIVLDGPGTGAENMRRDLELSEGVRDGRRSPTLRLYTWNPWCVSLGRHQNDTSIDAEYVRSRGFDIVQRPTGGRAVLHANEVTYCVCCPVQDSLEARRMYATVHGLLYQVLSSLTTDLSFASVDADLRQHYAANGPMGQVCFTSHARTEILWQGRKVVGSAQRVQDGVLLQHGSILCGPGHEQLAECIRTDANLRTSLKESIARSSATLSDAAGRTITQYDVIDAFQAVLPR